MESASMERKELRGSMTVEACLILPVCLCVMMAMAGTFQFLQLEESLIFSGFSQIRKCSADMSMSYSAARINRLYLEHRIMDQTLEEMKYGYEKWIHLVGVSEGGMFFSQEEWEDYEEISCKIHCRWSCGNDKNTGDFSDELRFYGRIWRGESSPSVWIFPSWGECYHDEFCYVTGGTKIRTVLDVASEQGYRPCQHCMKGE